MKHLARAAALALSLFVANSPAVFAQGAAAAGAEAAPPASAKASMPALRASAVTMFVGTVNLQRRGSSVEERVTKAPLLVDDGDRLTTGEDSEARARLKDGSTIRLASGSDAVIGVQTADEVVVRLSLGKLWAKVSKLRARSFEVRTPASVASVRGTEFSVAVLGPKAAVTEVQSGLVAVRALLDDKPIGGEALLSAGQSVKADGGKLGVAAAIQSMMTTPKPQSQAQQGSAAAIAATPGMTPAALRAAVAVETARQLGQEAMQRASISANTAPQSQESMAELQATAVAAASANAEAPAPGEAPAPADAAGAAPTMAPTAPSPIVNTGTTLTAATIDNAIPSPAANQPPTCSATVTTNCVPATSCTGVACPASAQSGSMSSGPIVPTNSNYNSLCPSCPKLH